MYCQADGKQLRKSTVRIMSSLKQKVLGIECFGIELKSCWFTLTMGEQQIFLNRQIKTHCLCTIYHLMATDQLI